MILGFGGQVWLHFTRVDLPAVLARLVGLGYSTSSAYYLGQELRVNYMDLEGKIAEKGFEDGFVRIYYNEYKVALGVVSNSQELLRLGLAELYRALIESGASQPHMVEAHISFSTNLQIKGRVVSTLGLELREGGFMLVGAREGLEVRVTVMPIQGDRKLVTIYLGGNWDSVVPLVNNAQQTVQDILSVLG